MSFRPYGAGLHAPRGTLPYDADEDRVQCHLCGRWYRALAPNHVLSHGLDAEEYRQIAGLKPSTPLIVPSLSQLRARQLRERAERDERIQLGMWKGFALARTGLLQQRARRVAGNRGSRLERERELAEDGRVLGRRRAERFRQQRERRARDLGFPSLNSYLRARYVQDRARIEDLTTELDASYSAVRADLNRAGIAVTRDRPRRRS